MNLNCYQSSPFMQFLLPENTYNLASTSAGVPLNFPGLLQLDELNNVTQRNNNNTKTPVHYLNQFIDGDIIKLLIDEADKSVGTQERSKKFTPVSEPEMRVLIAINYLLGYLQVPRRRMLWERVADTRNNLVVNAIQRDRYEAICISLNALQEYNEALKYCMNEKFLAHVGRDEQHNIKELQVKGYKVWCACIKNTYCTWFTINEADPHLTIHSYIQRMMNLRRISEINIHGTYSNESFLNGLLRYETNVTFVPPNKSVLVAGIDRLEANLNLYSMKKVEFLTIVLELAMCNAYVMYKAANEERRCLDMLGFRREIVVEYLEHYGRNVVKHASVHRPIDMGRTAANSTATVDPRYDGIKHYVIPNKKHSNCALCDVKAKTKCLKCDVGLHVKCFVEFHTKP